MRRPQGTRPGPGERSPCRGWGGARWPPAAASLVRSFRWVGRTQTLGAGGSPVLLTGYSRPETFLSPGGWLAPHPQDCLPCENRAERGHERLSPSGISCPRRALAGRSPLPLPGSLREPCPGSQDQPRAPGESVRPQAGPLAPALVASTGHLRAPPGAPPCRPDALPWGRARSRAGH